MGRWAPQETDTMAAIAAEITQNTGTARTLVAIDGQPGVDLERVAHALVAALQGRGVKAMVAAAASADAESLRAELVNPFRTIGTDPGVLVVTGHRVLAADVRGLWHFTVWAERDRDLPDAEDDAKGHASVVLDVSDPVHPRRNWNDAC